MGITVQTSYVASKLSMHETDEFFYRTAKQIDEKVNVFVKRSVPDCFVFVNYLKLHCMPQIYITLGVNQLFYYSRTTLNFVFFGTEM